MKMNDNNANSNSERKNALMNFIEHHNLKVINIIGYSNSGKTASIENLIMWLKSNNKIHAKVAVVKNIAHNDFVFDAEGKNTYRFSQVGADVVVGKSKNQSVLIMNREIDLLNLVTNINLEFDATAHFERLITKRIIILEGFRDFPGPSILAIRTSVEADSQFNDNIKCFIGAIGSDPEELQKIRYKYTIPYVDCVKEPEKLYFILFGWEF